MVWIIFACLGLNYILMHSKILDWPRNKLKSFSFFSNLIRCAYCCGFWSGLILMWFINYEYYYLLPLISCYICGAAESIISIFE